MQVIEGKSGGEQRDRPRRKDTRKSLKQVVGSLEKIRFMGPPF